MVPGSGSHATAGGAARRLMYRSSNPAQTVAWTAGGDATFNSQGAADTNPATRFNASGQITTFSAGQAHPTKANTVFNTDFTDYTKRTRVLKFQVQSVTISQKAQKHLMV